MDTFERIKCSRVGYMEPYITTKIKKDSMFLTERRCPKCFSRMHKKKNKELYKCYKCGHVIGGNNGRTEQ